MTNEMEFKRSILVARMKEYISYFENANRKRNRTIDEKVLPFLEGEMERILSPISFYNNLNEFEKEAI